MGRPRHPRHRIYNIRPVSVSRINFREVGRRGCCGLSCRVGCDGEGVGRAVDRRAENRDGCVGGGIGSPGSWESGYCAAGSVGRSGYDRCVSRDVVVPVVVMVVVVPVVVMVVVVPVVVMVVVVPVVVMVVVVPVVVMVVVVVVVVVPLVVVVMVVPVVVMVDVVEGAVVVGICVEDSGVMAGVRDVEERGRVVALGAVEPSLVFVELQE
ncbi:hypothetical protein E2C01_044567 [Portunus trituberculatus]|uniref:Uncharacterized protein n=1 Tax=Portunus trituberculatus TaxID=210409 RepID=A0A5B7FZI6_PORTR|nr:hypothetical protein [Portunus trituberculatus]